MTAQPGWTFTEKFQFRLSVWNPNWMYESQRILYQLTGGRLMGNVRGIPVLLLTTTGRKSGKRRTKPLVYLGDGGDYVVCAANAGLDSPPAWWLNLQQTPQATIQVGARRYSVRAEHIEGQRRDALWHKLCQLNPFYAEFQKRTGRMLDLVVLRVV